MPKATLTFDLPDEEYDFRQALNGPLYCRALWKVSQKLRDMRKYRELPTVTAEVVGELEDIIRELPGELLEEVT